MKYFRDVINVYKNFYFLVSSDLVYTSEQIILYRFKMYEYMQLVMTSTVLFVSKKKLGT